LIHFEKLEYFNQAIVNAEDTFVKDCDGPITSLGNNVMSDTVSCAIVLQRADNFYPLLVQQDKIRERLLEASDANSSMPPEVMKYRPHPNAFTGNHAEEQDTPPYQPSSAVRRLKREKALFAMTLVWAHFV